MRTTATRPLLLRLPLLLLALSWAAHPCAAHDPLEQARERAREAVERIARGCEAAGRILHPPAEPRASSEERVRSGDVLVMYALDAPEAMAIVVTRDTARVVALGASEHIASACAALEAAGPTSDWTVPLARLRSLVIEPLALPASTRGLRVSADGPLCHVPFAALVGALTVAHVAWGTTQAARGEGLGKRGEEVLAVADPEPGRRKVGGEGDALRVRPLPWARAEAGAVGDVVLLGAAASEQGLAAALASRPRWRAVHLASVCVIDREQPGRSSIVLTPEAPEDGALQAIEIARARIQADLVVLSAGSSARGTPVPGEGLLGLPRAFLQAGVPEVIGALWDVDDEATAALMTRFYELWSPRAQPGDPERAQRAEGSKGRPGGASGLSAAEALRQAQQFVASQERWKHPTFWAAWVLWALP